MPQTASDTSTQHIHVKEDPEEYNLTYHQNWELRREIAYLAGIESERYDYDGLGERRSFCKDHLYEIARQVGNPPDDLTLAELYRWVCGKCGVEYNETAGNQWGLGRAQLKAIFRTMVTVHSQEER